MATQFADIFPQLRATLEYAACGLYIEKNPDAEAILLNRHSSAEDLKKARNTFVFKKLAKTITKYNNYIGKVSENLYQTTIDFGAHPNERSITSNLGVSTSDEYTNYSMIYMHEDTTVIRTGLILTIQIGLCSLEILQEVFSARYQIKGVKSEILKLRREINYPI